MTTNQLAYHRLQEDIRHNVAMEIENYRSNVAGENIAWFNAYEKKRADLADEGIRSGELMETASYHAASLKEENRSNVEREKLSWAELGLGWANYSVDKAYKEASIAVKQDELQLRQNQLALDRERLDMDWYKAETGRISTDIDKLKAEYQLGQLDVAWAQVALDQQRVENQSQELDIRQDELLLKQDQFRHDKKMDESRDKREWWDLGLTAFASAFNSVSNNAFRLNDSMNDRIGAAAQLIPLLA